MMNDIIKAFQLVEEEKYKEAYEAFSNLIGDKALENDARYSRAMIDISRLKEHFENTINDLKELINKKTKYAKISYSFLTLVYDELDMIDEVIKYGKLAIINDTPFANEIYFALSRAYARRGNDEDLEEALKMINECLKDKELEEELDYLICKCDILISLEKFDEASQEIDHLVSSFGHSGVVYYLKARLAMKKYYKTDHIALVDEAIYNAEICLQYEEHDYSVKTLLIEGYTIKKDYTKALEIIDTMKTEVNEEDMIMEKVKVYDDAKEYQKALDLIIPYLHNHQSWKLKYMEGALLLDMDSNKIEMTLNCFREAYELFPNNGIMLDILKVNRMLKREEDNYQFLQTIIQTRAEGIIYFNLAETALRINKPYDEIIKYYYQVYELGYIDKLEYYDSICNYTNSKKMNKIIKKNEKNALQGDSVWSKRKVAIRYIYQENGYHQNLKKGKKIIEQCLNEYGDDSCTLSLYARCLELSNNNQKAFHYYQKAYEKIKKVIEPDCDCAYGYYAYAKISGIGTDVEIDEAKNIILSVINKSGKYTCSHIVYFYAYFYLLNDERFSGEFAKEMLEENYPFYRYEISRIVLLSQVINKLKIKSNKLDELLLDMDEYDKNEIKYYNENIYQKASLPYWKNI